MKLNAIITLLCVVGTLTGCGSTPSPLLTSGKDLFQGIGKRKAAPVTAATIRQNLTPEVLAQIKGPIILAEIPSRDAAAALILSGKNGQVQTFASQDGLSLSFRHGMLINTRGLGNDLMSADVEGPLKAVMSRTEAPQVTRVHRYLDGENQTVTRSFICRYSRAASKVTETCNSTNLQFENQYILNPAVKISSSKQWISPTIGYVTTQTIRN